MWQVDAAVTDGQGNFTIEKVTVMPPERDEVIVEIKAAGVCHTDYDSLRWGKPYVLGHEGAGIVKEVGANVTHVRAGDPVLLNWALPCGSCFQCQRGNLAICENKRLIADERTQYQGQGLARSFGLGTMSSLAAVCKEAVIPLEGTIPFASAALLGCCVMTGYGSVVNIARVMPGSSVVVIGAGGVGLNVIQGARIAGASTIIALDLKPERLFMARQFGATHTFQPSVEDALLINAAETVKTMTGGRGADYAFECTAVPRLGASPLAMVRNGGTAVQASGIEETIEIDMNLFEWNKTYINPLYGGCRPEIDFPILMALYAQGTLKLDQLVTRVYPLHELSQAFEDMHHGINAKGVLVMS